MCIVFILYFVSTYYLLTLRLVKVPRLFIFLNIGTYLQYVGNKLCIVKTLYITIEKAFELLAFT